MDKPSSYFFGSHASNKITLTVWILIFTGTIFGFSCHIYYLISRFMEYPVTSVTYHRTAPIIWPDITICPTGRVDLDRISSHRYGSEYFRWSYSFNNYTSFWRRFLFTVESTEKFTKVDAYNLALLNMYWNEKESKLAFKQRHDVVFQCEFQEKECTYQDFTLHKSPSLFNCFTFRPRNRKIELPGKKYGLRVLLHLGSSNIAWVPQDKRLERFRGFRVAIHQPYTLPDFNKNTFDVAVGTRTDVNVFGERLKRVNRSSAYCYNVQKSWYQDFLKNDRYCEEVMLQQHFWRTCGCLSPDLYPLPESAVSTQSCTGYGRIRRAMKYDTKSLAKLRSIHFYYQCYVKTSKQLYELAVEGSHCLTPCIEDSYKILTSGIKWPQNAMNAKVSIENSFERNVNLAMQSYSDVRTLLKWQREFYLLFNNQTTDLNVEDEHVKTIQDDYVQDRFALLKVYVSGTHIDTAAEEMAYPFSSLLSDIGGSMGMWVGFSFLTIVEVVERFIKISMNRWQRRKSLLTPSTTPLKTAPSRPGYLSTTE